MKFTFPPESRPLDGYTIKRAIHRGGFGEVYYAVSDSGREVALKLLQHNTEVELRGVQQCLNLSHPNLVTIFNVQQDGDGDHWIVMEFVPGDTLDAVIRRYPQGMPLELIRKWVNGVVAGGTYLHQRGIVHRDLKPGNIFSDGETIKIGDIGLSKFITHSRRSAQTQSVGTVYYMAPEVAKGRYGKEVDVYALGVMIYEMLTGSLPFDGESTGEILMKHLSEPPDLTRLPPRLQRVIGRALEKDPTRRFDSLESFGTAFEAALLGRDEPQPVPAANRPIEVTFADMSTDSAGARTSANPPRQKPADSLTGLLPSARGWMFIVAAGVLAASQVHSGSGLEFVIPPVLFAAGGAYLWLLFLQNAPFAGMRDLASRVLSSRDAVRRDSVLPPRERAKRRIVGQYLGAAALTVPLVGLLTLGLIGIAPQTTMERLTGSTELDLAMAAFVVATSTLLSWTILLIPALYRLHYGEEPKRRLPYALGGLGLGVLVSLLAEYLMIHTPAARGVFERIGDHPLSGTSDMPSALGFIVFTTLLLCLRDWRQQTLPVRAKRFSISKVLGTIIVAWLITAIFSFPQSLAVICAALTSITVQLCSPWYERRRRGAL
ncbi:MAG: serine/threonine protein kinase [Planctomycetaceae bacterium]|nr:serine/threonine protein kinase [Planctomycetaceae bacterium]